MYKQKSIPNQEIESRVVDYWSHAVVMRRI